MDDGIHPNDELLPESDRDFLRAKELAFSVTPEGGSLLLVIRDFPFPPAYTPRTADLLVIIPSGYPNGQLDMFWTFPDVKLADGSWPAASQVKEQHCGRSWQRWSRHNPTGWRMGIDDLRTFLAAVKSEINRGI